MTGGGGVLPRFSRSQVAPRTVVVVILTALALLGLLYLLWQLQQIVRWMVIALFLAVALGPAVDWLNRRRVPRVLAILLVYLALLLVLVGMGALVVPPLVEQIDELVEFATGLAQQPGGPEQGLRDLAARFGFGGYYDTLREQLSTLPSRLGGAVAPLLAVTRGVVGSITAFISILLLALFLLLDGERFIEAGLNLFNPAQRPRLRRLLGQSADAIHGYINGNLAISLIAGVATFIVLTILRVPYTVVLALIVALFDLIPLVGSTLGAAVVVLTALFVAEPWKAGALVGFFLVYQQIENNILQPLVYGRSVKLHPLAIFLAVLAGAQLLGILGALLAIPVAEIGRILGAEWLASRARATGGVAHDTRDDTPVERVTADAAGPAS
jgi:predicted PurR-regulated permease PerM